MASYPAVDRIESHGSRDLPRENALLRQRLLAWYDRCRRELPWRAPPGETADAYGVWLSEVMLQQTTTLTVAGYWRAFRARWPRLEDLADAPLEDVLHAWQGLGYYARARNLHACARRIVELHGGRFPADEAALRRLPGVGAYTAAAIAAIACDLPAVPVDGNVIRVLARLHAVEVPLPAARTVITHLAEGLAAAERPGDFAQALMDLGATVCTPRRPRCGDCPWQQACAGRRSGMAESYPRPAPAAVRPTRHGVVFWAEREDGKVLVRRRPLRGLLGGMIEFPSTPWRDAAWTAAEAIAIAPVDARWTPLPGSLRHTFTHFHLRLDVVHGRCSAARGREAAMAGEPRWCAPADFPALALPTLMKKVAGLATTAADRTPLLPLAPYES